MNFDYLKQKQIKQKRESLKKEDDTIEKKKDLSEIISIDKLNKTPVKNAINPKIIFNEENENKVNSIKTFELNPAIYSEKREDNIFMKKNTSLQENKKLQKNLISKKEEISAIVNHYKNTSKHSILKSTSTSTSKIKK